MCRSFFGIILSISLAVGVFLFQSSRSEASDIDFGPTTPIGEVFSGIEDLVKQLEASASKLLQEGNVALARQQQLLSSLLGGLVDQLKTAYKESLDQTIGQISVTQTNIYGDLQELVGEVESLETQVASDVQETVYQSQVAVNQIISRLPLTSRVPVFYGASIRDAFSELPEVGFDIELLGFNWRDAKLDNKLPNIKVDDEEIPNSSIAVIEDRIQIVLPDSVKEKIGFASDFCNPQRSWKIDVDVFFSEDRWFGGFGTGWLGTPLGGFAEKMVRSSAFVPAGKPVFDVVLFHEGTQVTTAVEQRSFQADSSLVTVGCEAWNSGNIGFTAPPGSYGINCQAGWVGEQRLSDRNASCSIVNQTVSATGSIRGRNRHCWGGGLLGPRICNCPGGGQGNLRVTGTYSINTSSSAPVAATEFQRGTLTAEYATTLPEQAGYTASKISAQIRRKSCDVVFDAINLVIPANSALVSKQTSQNGHFELEHRNKIISLSTRN